MTYFYEIVYKWSLYYEIDLHYRKLTLYPLPHGGKINSLGTKYKGHFLELKWYIIVTLEKVLTRGGDKGIVDLKACSYIKSNFSSY